MELKAQCKPPELSIHSPQKDLTVGDHIFLDCELTSSEGAGVFQFEKAEFVLDEKDLHTIKILKAIPDAGNRQHFGLDMTVYVPGDISFSSLKMTDGQNFIELPQQKFHVQSVIEVKPGAKPEDKPEPYGYQVLSLPWPWIYSVIFLVLFIFALAVVGFQIYRALYWNKLIKKIKNYDSPTPADIQFYREIRYLEKKHEGKENSAEAITVLEKICQTYILRSYQVPLFDLNPRQVSQFLRKKSPQFKSERRQIFNLLRDIQLLKKSTDDTHRLAFVKRMYDFIDHTENLKQKGKLQ